MVQFIMNYTCVYVWVCGNEKEWREREREEDIHIYIERERKRERGETYSCIVVVHTSTNVSSMHDLQGLDTNAMPGYKDSDVKLLPSSTTKHAIWELYFQAAAASSMRAVAYFSFTDLWCQLLPNIVVMKPMSDLC